MNDLQEWTIMFFFAGDNSIAASMISQLKAITDAGYQEDTTVLVHFDPNTNESRAQVFDVNRHRKDDPESPSTVIGDGRDFYVRSIRDACDERIEVRGKSAADTLQNFLEYGRTNFRARNYLLFLVGHGMIVANDSFLPDTDVDSASAITLKELGSVLKKFGDQARKEKSTFQLVGFHSCSMSAVEVAYELKDTARYMIGTQGLAFPNSWPYRQVLKMIFLKIDKSTRQNGATDRKKVRTKLQPDYDRVTEEILERIQDLSFHNADDFALAGYSADVSLCSLDGNKLDPLTNALKTLSRSLKAGLEDSRTKEVILLAHWKAQSYWQENYTDLYDFCRCLLEQCHPENKAQVAIKQACSVVLSLLATSSNTSFDRLVACSDFFGPAYQYSHGLSIYFPWASPSEGVLQRYEQYAFVDTMKPATPTNGGQPEEDGSWLSFLKAYFHRTQRSTRSDEPKVKISFNGGTGEGVPTVSLEIGEGKPTPSMGGEGKPTPSMGGEGKPTPSMGIGEGKPTPSMGIGEGKPTPSMGIGEGKPTPSMGIGEGKPTPSMGIGEGKPTPSMGIGEGKPTPSMGIGEGKPTPSMGGGGFNFTVTKNFPAPDSIVSSRWSSSQKESSLRGKKKPKTKTKSKTAGR